MTARALSTSIWQSHGLARSIPRKLLHQTSSSNSSQQQQPSQLLNQQLLQLHLQKNKAHRTHCQIASCQESRSTPVADPDTQLSRRGETKLSLEVRVLPSWEVLALEAPSWEAGAEETMTTMTMTKPVKRIRKPLPSPPGSVGSWQSPGHHITSNLMEAAISRSSHKPIFLFLN